MLAKSRKKNVSSGEVIKYVWEPLLFYYSSHSLAVRQKNLHIQETEKSIAFSPVSVGQTEPLLTTKFEEKHEKLQTVRPTSATWVLIQHLPSTTFESKTSQPMVGQIHLIS